MIPTPEEWDGTCPECESEDVILIGGVYYDKYKWKCDECGHEIKTTLSFYLADNKN